MVLIYGAEKSIYSEKNLAMIEGLSTRLDVQIYGFDAAVYTSQILAELAR